MRCLPDFGALLSYDVLPDDVKKNIEDGARIIFALMETLKEVYMYIYIEMISIYLKYELIIYFDLIFFFF